MIHLVSELSCFISVEIAVIEGKKENINVIGDSKLLNSSVYLNANAGGGGGSGWS